MNPSDLMQGMQSVTVAQIIEQGSSESSVPLPSFFSSLPSFVSVSYQAHPEQDRSNNWIKTKTRNLEGIKK
jgi:hypothetical protein